MRKLTILFAAIFFLMACVPVQPAAEHGAMESPENMASSESMMRETGATVTVQDLSDIIVHSYLAPEEIFANNTHIIETANSLVLIDTQFLLPMALDFRAYADSLGKPVERLIITHEHPDHFLGSEAFADVDIYALEEVSAAIAEIGQAEVDEKQAQFGDAIASTFVVPMVLEPGTVEIDGVTFEFVEVMDAEAEIQVVTKVPGYGVIAVGDIVYSGLHLILAGNPPTWIEALENLKADSDDYPIVLPGHGASTDPSVYDANIAWLMKAGKLMGTATSGDEFKAGLVEAFPELGLATAIDFVLPFLFPAGEAEDSAMQEDGDSHDNVAIAQALIRGFETGNPAALDSISDETYIQHNLAFPSGKEVLGGFFTGEPSGIEVETVRAFADGDFVVLHSTYGGVWNNGVPQVAFDIFRFEDGLIVEHWDNLQDIVTETASGRSQTDGPTEVIDLDKTDANKSLVEGFMADVLMGGAPEKITDYVSTETYYQHNPAVADGLPALGEALQAMVDAGTPMVYEESHLLLGQGNFVLTASEGQFLGNHVAFYDLFRIEDGLIVEHWDIIEQIPPQEEWKNDNGKF